MNKSQKFLLLLKEEDDSEETRSSLDKFLEPSQAEKEQNDAIDKFRLRKQLRYLKKYQNNTKNDNDTPTSNKERTYYWDANVNRTSGG